MLTLGLDGYPRGWVVAAMEDGRVAELAVIPAITTALARWPSAAAIAIDIPIGLPEGAMPRPADLEARAMLGPRRGSVFLTAPSAVIEALTHPEAIALARQLGCPAPSAQAYALRPKILEAAVVAAADERIIEVHPELAFRVLNGAPLAASKRSWDGLNQRLRLLEDSGIVLPGSFPGGGAAAADDVLDAVICALVASRYATGHAACVPALPHPSSRHHRIWYAGPAR